MTRPRQIAPLRPHRPPVVLREDPPQEGQRLRLHRLLMDRRRRLRLLRRMVRRRRLRLLRRMVAAGSACSGGWFDAAGSACSGGWFDAAGSACSGGWFDAAGSACTSGCRVHPAGTARRMHAVGPIE
ncbi:hypothetical protein GCM10007304_32100 [Rhodococcoides trifolii]|uniref:Uncharacterized protein n=1 Tax=Rhodococcoides trifolii TaxID=908250 RepID=A0A917FZS9_9NOCA|nr:hypothetical protein [Rhodococcus trifolii]GGG15576.1 hypothetical protein GCM10007304_32100 [Rhodococcus trifolii]